MPLRIYNNAADWEAAYGYTAPRCPSHPEYTDYEWLQEDMTFGPIETRGTFGTPGQPEYVCRQKRVRFIDNPLRWQVNFYQTGRAENLPEYWYERRNRILQEHTIGLSDRILVVAAGTGALIKAFKDVGYENVWGLEPSPWIQGNTARQWPGVVLVNEDIAGSQLVQRLRQATGDSVFHWIITEDMFSGYTDAELTQIRIQPSTRFVDLPVRLLAPGRPTSSVINMVSTFGDPSIVNAHSLEWWQTLAPEQTWMEAW